MKKENGGYVKKKRLLDDSRLHSFFRTA